MKVKMKASISGNADERYELPSFSFIPGQVVDVHEFLAMAWVAADIAELEEERSESAEVPEFAVRPRKRSNPPKGDN